MSSGVSSASGTTISIGTKATDPTADTYTAIGSIESIGAYGASFNKITFEDLGLGEIVKLKGARDDGTVTVAIGLDQSDAGQLAVRAAIPDKDDYNFKVEYNDASPAQSKTVTISVAAPGVVTWVGHGLTVGAQVEFSTTGELPTGLAVATPYFVKTVSDEDTFTVAATKGGAAITTTVAGSGTDTGTTVPAASFDVFKAKVMSFQKNPGSLSDVTKGSIGLEVTTGSMVETPRAP
jgi:hypothetical protein